MIVSFTTQSIFRTDGGRPESVVTICGTCGARFNAADPELLAGHAVSHSADRSDQLAWWQEQARLATADENLAGVRAAKAALPQGK